MISGAGSAHGENLLDERLGNFLSPIDFADLVGEDKFDFTGADFLIQLHGGEEFFAAGGIQFNFYREAGGDKQFLNAVHFTGGKTEDFLGKPGGGDLADGDGLAVEVFAVAGAVFNGVTEGVAEIKDGAEAAFSFVLAHDVGFDIAAAGDNAGEGGGIAFQKLGQVALDLGEENGVVDDAVFDDF